MNAWMMIGDWVAHPMNARPLGGRVLTVELIDSLLDRLDMVVPIESISMKELHKRYPGMMVTTDPLCWACKKNKALESLGGHVCHPCWQGGYSPSPPTPTEFAAGALTPALPSGHPSAPSAGQPGPGAGGARGRSSA